MQTFKPSISGGDDHLIPHRLLPNFAVMGKMGAGKTSIAEILEQDYGYQRLSFAAELKRIAVDLFGPDALTNRKLMQDLGRYMREIDPMVWVNKALSHLVRFDGDVPRLPIRVETFRPRELRESFAPVVVDDLRFPNEFHALRKEGFVILNVEAHRNQRVNRLKAIAKLQDESQMEDISETALDGAIVDYTLTNTTTLVELRNLVQTVVAREVRRNA